MERLSALKNQLIIIAAALGWAFIADPLISRLALAYAPAHRDLFRSLNYLIVILLVSLILYRRISRQATEVRQTRDDYRRLFDEVPVPMFIFDSRDFRFLAVNSAATVQYGYSQAEFLQLKITDIRPPEEVPAFLAAVGQVPDRYADAGRWLHRKKNGETFFVRIFSHHTVFEGLPAKQTLVIDIDQKVRTETALAEKSAELENMLDSITDGFYALNSRWEVTYINKAAEKTLCCTKGDILGKNLWDFFPNSRDGRFYAEYERAMNERISVQFEGYYAPLGVWGSMSVYPTKEGIAVYFVDITEQKKIQEKIYNDGQNLRAIINNTRDLIWSVDLQSRIITGNQAFWTRVKELTGKGEEEVSNADFVQERVAVFFESYERAFKGEAFSLVRQRELDGRQVFEELSFNPIRDIHQSVIGVNCFLRDITDAQQYLHQIEEQNKRLREIAWIQSHRVRAPVASILGLAQLCDPNDSPNAEIIPMLKKSAEDLDRVIMEITALTQDLDKPGSVSL
ncbi:PAS domain S-box protein [Mucilaginibacter flavus]|uniref:PAS domain S-box protein n=1 Tax=Mucilaginibacter flavus TaxID=931504 RepID=UPI0025B566A8|nr:PAS domain S-box protein [Mucilaginibacter flavus]MDN3583416.1 PAS domain S-box protein [Mucilaginibacter flavus]